MSPECSGNEVRDDHDEGQDLGRLGPDDVSEGDERGGEESDGQRAADLKRKRYKFYVLFPTWGLYYKTFYGRNLRFP